MTSKRVVLVLGAAAALAGFVGLLVYGQVSHVALDEAELPPALTPAEIEALRDRCRSEPRTCGDLGRAYVRAWAERTVRAPAGPLRYTSSEENAAAYLYQRACGAGDEVACTVAWALEAREPEGLRGCPARRVRLVDEAGTPVVGVSQRSECVDEAGVTQFTSDTSDVDGWIVVAAERIQVGALELEVSDPIVVPAHGWSARDNGGGYPFELAAGEDPPAVPLRRDPWPSPAASGGLDGWWWRQADPVSDQVRQPWIALSLPGATGGGTWPEPPPRVLRLGKAKADAGVAWLVVDHHPQVLVAITADSVVAFEWTATGFNYPYRYRRGG